jgi:hypothetical protein
MMTTPPLIIRGFGAVSTAGWSAADLVTAVTTGADLPSITSQRSLGARDWDCRVRPVPPPPSGLLPKHPRLRRVSNVSRFAIAAAIEAMGAAPQTQSLGIIMCLMNGCVGFTNRFYNEVIDQPALASPILFPETVFNAPTSHIAAYLGASGQVTTLIGESNIINEALRLAAIWMQSGLVDQCLIIGAEEADWLSTEAVGYYDKRVIVTEGAGAMLVGLEGDGPRIEHQVGPFAYHSTPERRVAVQQMVEALPRLPEATLIDGQMGVRRLDSAEAAAWAGRPVGKVLHPHQVLGESLGSASALQLVLAAAMAAGAGQTSVLSMPGANTAAYGCVVLPQA